MRLALKRLVFTTVKNLANTIYRPLDLQITPDMAEAQWAAVRSILRSKFPITFFKISIQVGFGCMVFDLEYPRYYLPYLLTFQLID